MPGLCNRPTLHATAVARAEQGVLLLGPSGSGKSDLALRLIVEHGFILVADDRVELEDGVASSPHSLAGLLEVRGLGIVRLPHLERAQVALIVDLAAPIERLPPARPGRRLALDAFAPSAPAKLILALESLDPRCPPAMFAGAFPDDATTVSHA